MIMGFNRHFESVLDIEYGKDPSLDALLMHFMTENHLEYTIDPDKNASSEQMRVLCAVLGLDGPDASQGRPARLFAQGIHCPVENLHQSIQKFLYGQGVGQAVYSACPPQAPHGACFTHCHTLAIDEAAHHHIYDPERH